MAARRSDEVRANEEIVDDRVHRSRWPIYDRNRDERFPPRAGTYGAKGGSEKGGSASGTRDGPPGRSSGIVPGLQYYGSTPKQHAAPKYIRPVSKAKARGGIREDPRSPSPPDQEGLPDEQRSRRFGRQEYHRYSRSRSPCSREPLRPRREERGAEETPGTKSCTISSGQHPYVQRKSREEKLAIRDQCPRAPRAPRPSSQPRLVEESRSPPPVRSRRGEPWNIPGPSASRAGRTPALPEVDPEVDHRTFAVLDEACSKSCHSPQWHSMAEARGQTMPVLYGEEREYKGLGNVMARGKRKIRIGVTLGSGDIITGTLVSHELNRGNTPLLLGLHAQATLGIAKDVRLCACTIDREPVQLYKMRDSGLRALCISEINSRPGASGSSGGQRSAGLDPDDPVFDGEELLWDEPPMRELAPDDPQPVSRRRGDPPAPEQPRRKPPADLRPREDLVPRPPSRPPTGGWRYQPKYYGTGREASMGDEGYGGDYDGGYDDPHTDQKAYFSRAAEEGVEEEEGPLPYFDTQSFKFSDSQLNELYFAPKKRSYRTYVDGHQVHVKRDTKNSGLKVNTVNCNACKTSYVYTQSGGWFKAEDRIDINRVGDCEPFELEDGSLKEYFDVIVVVHKEFLTAVPQGGKRQRYEAYVAVASDEMPRGILSPGRASELGKSVNGIRFADSAMWACFRSISAPLKPLYMGCQLFLLATAVFCDHDGRYGP